MSRDRTTTGQLVGLAKEGDREALDELVARYYDRVLRIVRRRCGAGLRRDVESHDILHESLTVALRHLRQFDMRDRGSLLRWLRAIVENRIRDRVEWQHAACRSHDREIEIDDTRHGAEIDAEADTSTPLDAASEHERRHLLEESLDALEPTYRDVLVARDFDGLGWKDIAARTGRPSADAARMMYHKALIALGTSLRRRAEP